MQLQKLREKHPAFYYKSFDIREEGNKILVSFDFRIEPNITFRPEITIPCSQKLPESLLKSLVFNLGLVEMISYWKCTCSPAIVIEAGSLSREQVAWWSDLLIHGLGEFYCRNDIDFTANEFFKLFPASDISSQPETQFSCEKGELILSGGGKDSAVTLELLRKKETKQAALILNPTRAALDAARIAGYKNPLLLKRIIDPHLIKLNLDGYLNGHTPFSAYLAFVSVLAAALNGYDTVISSNEASADEANTEFHGLNVNHQYSKTTRFEGMFRSYCEQSLRLPVQYFSFLRPISELQISRLFSRFTKQVLSFRSCNINQKKDSWCCSCPKCAFVYLTLFPYVDRMTLLRIFGEDLFLRPQIQTYLWELTGLRDQKPFECVGTAAESQAAVMLGIRKCLDEGVEPAPILRQIEEVLKDQENVDDPHHFLISWNNEHYVPERYLAVLKEALLR